MRNLLLKYHQDGCDGVTCKRRIAKRFAFVSIATCGRSTVASSRVIAGTDASLGEWPWQAWLDIEGSGFSCGGSLIAPQWVLTAAHCILEPEPSKYKVILGDVKHKKNEKSEQIFKVDKIIVHENYEKPVVINNDVALMKLSKPARINAIVRPVCLPSPHEMVPLKTKCYITGNFALGRRYINSPLSK